MEEDAVGADLPNFFARDFVVSSIYRQIHVLLRRKSVSESLDCFRSDQVIRLAGFTSQLLQQRIDELRGGGQAD